MNNKNRMDESLSILVTAWKTDMWIGECLDSILAQDFPLDQIEVLLGIDACKQTLEKVAAIREKYGRLSMKTVFFKKNCGTYVVSNTLACMARHKNLLRFDSDDVMKPWLLRTVMQADSRWQIIRFGYVNKTEMSVERGEGKSHACGAFFITKSLFMLAGGFLPWKCSADAEFQLRMRPFALMELHIDKPLFDRRVHPGSLSQSKETGLDSEFRKHLHEKLFENHDNNIIQIKMTTEKKHETVFDLSDYWERRYLSGGNSGAGSYGKEAEAKGMFINNLIHDRKIQTVMDWSVGDGNNLKYINGYLHYTGFDISPQAVKICKLQGFKNCSFTTEDSRCDWNADLGVSMDTLFHQVEDRDYNDLLQRIFFKANHKYVLLYTTSNDNNIGLSPHMKNRPVKEDVENLDTEFKLIQETPSEFPGDKYYFLYERQ